MDHPAALDLRRFTLYGATENDPNGEILGVGVQFPDGTVAVDLRVPTPPTTFDSMGELGERAGTSLANGPGNDTWVEYEDADMSDDHPTTPSSDSRNDSPDLQPPN